MYRVCKEKKKNIVHHDHAALISEDDMWHGN